MTEREAFEHYLLEEAEVPPHYLSKDSDGNYNGSMVVQCDWATWQEAIAYARAEQASQPQWIPVSERQPNDKQQVLGFDNGSIKTLTCDHFKCGKVEFWQDHAGYVFNVTHWMPLPAAPKSAI